MATIVVVDDRDPDRELLSTLLTCAGHTVHEACDGTRGLQAALAHRPDLVITDLLMPGMNGYELAHHVHCAPDLTDVQVVFCTANYAEHEAARLAEACGVARILTKPYDPERMIAAIGEIVGTPRPLTPLSAPEGFEREQLRLLNDKLVQKVTELERVNLHRRRLLVEVARVTEDERRRIAAGLHDDELQTLATVGLRLDLLARELDDPRLIDRVVQLRSQVGGVGERLRRLLFELRPLELETGGLATALTALAVTVEESGLRCWVHADRLDAEPDPATQVLLYRAAAELVHNAQKHARCDTVEVLVARERGGYRVAVTDDGCGFDVADALEVRSGHLGLPALVERVEGVGGRVAFDTLAGRGTHVEVWLPGPDWSVDAAEAT